MVHGLWLAAVGRRCVSGIGRLVRRGSTSAMGKLLVSLRPTSVTRLYGSLGPRRTGFVCHLLSGRVTTSILIRVSRSTHGRLLRVLPSRAVTGHFISCVSASSTMSLVHRLSRSGRRRILSRVRSVRRTNSVISLLGCSRGATNNLVNARVMLIGRG